MDFRQDEVGHLRADGQGALGDAGRLQLGVVRPMTAASASLKRLPARLRGARRSAS